MKNFPNLTFHMLNSLVCISIYYVNFIFMSADLYSCTADLTLPMDLPWKLHQFDLSFVKFLGVYLNLLCQFYLNVSWFLQLHRRFDITNGFALKNYTNLTFHLLNSLVCISIYVNYTFITADLYGCTSDLNSQLDWPSKTTPIYLSIVKFLVCISIYVNFTFISADLYSCTADINSPLYWPWKTTSIWLFIC